MTKIEFLLFVLLLTACVSGNKKNNESGSNEKSLEKSYIKGLDKNECYVIDVDNVKEEKTLSLSEIFKPIKTIVLETKKECLIGRINKMYVDDNSIVILDADIAKGIFVFDLQGKYIRKIGNIGGGPGEYSRPEDFTIDSNNKQIYVLDSNNKAILIYNLDNGKYIKNIKPDTDSELHHIQYVNGKIYSDAYFSSPSDNQYLLQEFDLNGSLINRFMNNNEYAKGWSNTNRINAHPFTSVSNDKSFFYEQFMDTVISIEKDNVIPSFTLKSKDLLTRSDVEKLEEYNTSDPKKIASFQITMHRMNKIRQFIDYLEYKDEIYVKYLNGSFVEEVLYNKQNKTTMKIKEIDNLLESGKNKDGMMLIFNFGCLSSHGIYKYVDSSMPSNMDDLKNRANNDFLIPTLDKLDMLKTLPDDSNPVIFYYEYK